jgi:hypothetical protein
MNTSTLFSIDGCARRLSTLNPLSVLQGRDPVFTSAAGHPRALVPNANEAAVGSAHGLYDVHPKTRLLELQLQLLPSAPKFAMASRLTCTTMRIAAPVRPLLRGAPRRGYHATSSAEGNRAGSKDWPWIVCSIPFLH